MRVSSPLIDTSKFVERLHSIEGRCGGNAYLRRTKLGEVRAEYMTARIAAKLRELAHFSELPQQELNAAAGRILAKAGSRSTTAPENERRTDQEERLVSSAKVGWHKLVKAEGLAPARAWSRAHPQMPKRKGMRRQIANANENSEEMRDTFTRYVAKQALHLLNACEEARSLDQRVVSPRIEQTVAALYSLCIGADPVSSSDSRRK